MHTTFLTGPVMWVWHDCVPVTTGSTHTCTHAHMHTSPPTCPCGEEDQTIEYVPQICNRHQPERIAQWPSATPLHQKLYGGLGGPEEDHQLHHCCWTGRVSEREERRRLLIKPFDVFCVTCHYRYAKLLILLSLVLENTHSAK